MGYLVRGRTFTSYYDAKFDKIRPVPFSVYLPNASSEEHAREIARDVAQKERCLSVMIDKVESGVLNSSNPASPLTVDFDAPWYEQRLVAFDVETTGFDPKDDRIVEIAFSEFDLDSKSFKEPVSYLVNDGIEIPESAEAIHGISNEMIADAPSFEDIVEDIYSDILVPGTILVAQNRGFDLGFLLSSLDRCPGEYYVPPCFCSMELSIRTPVGQRKHRLEIIADALGVEGNNSHRAGDDAQLCGDVFMELARRNKYWHTATVADAINYFDNTSLDTYGNSCF